MSTQTGQKPNLKILLVHMVLNNFHKKYFKNIISYLYPIEAKIFLSIYPSLINMYEEFEQDYYKFYIENLLKKNK